MNGKFTKAIAITGLVVVLAVAVLALAYNLNKNVRNKVNDNLGVVPVEEYNQQIDYVKLLEDNINNTRGQISALNLVIIDQEETIRIKQEQYYNLQSRYTQSRLDLREARNNIIALENNIAVLNSVIDERNEQISEAYATIETKNNRITVLRESISELNAIINEKNDAIAVMSTQKTNLEQQLSAKEEEIIAKQTEIVALSTQIEDLTAFVTGKYYCVDQDCLVEILSNGTVKLYENTQDYTVLNYTADGNYISVDLDGQTLQFEITSNMSFTCQTDLFDLLNANFVYVNEDIFTLIEDRENLTETLYDLANNYNQAVDHCSSAQSQVNTLNARITELEEEIVTLENSIASLNNQINALNASITQINEQLAIVTAEKEAIEEELATKNNEIAVLEAQLADAQATIAEYQNQIAELRTQLNNYQTIQANINGATVEYISNGIAFTGFTSDGTWYDCRFVSSAPTYEVICHFDAIYHASRLNIYTFGLLNTYIFSIDSSSMYLEIYGSESVFGLAFFDEIVETTPVCVIIDENHTIEEYSSNEIFYFSDFELELFSDSEHFELFGSDYLLGKVVKSVTLKFTSQSQPFATQDAGAGEDEVNGDGASLD